MRKTMEVEKERRTRLPPNSRMTSNHNFDRVSSIPRLRYIISLRLRSHYRKTVRYEWVGTLYKRNTYPNLCQPTRPLASNQLPLLSSLPPLLTLLLRDCILERYSHYLQGDFLEVFVYNNIAAFKLTEMSFIMLYLLYSHIYKFGSKNIQPCSIFDIFYKNNILIKKTIRYN